MSRSLYGWMKRRRMAPVDALTRREMLRRTAAGAALLFLSGNACASRGTGAGRRIVVVGAGFAGLAAAHELAAAGYDVTVVDARNRVGGRVLSFGDFVPGRNIEGGGELVGSNHATWLAYAEQFGLEFIEIVEPEEAEWPIVLGGTRLTKEEADALYEEMDAAVGQLNALAAPIDAQEPWTSPDAAALDARTVADWIAKLEVSQLCKAGITAQLQADMGTTTARQSLLAMLAQVKGGGLEKYWTDSETQRCKGGNQQLATKLAAALEESGNGRVKLSAPVARIDHGGAKALVTLADGTVIEADDVVLAVPPTTWSKIAIEPALPDALAPQMGIATKFLAMVKSRFWETTGLAADGLTDGPIGWTWDATNGQEGGEGAACLVAFSGGPGAITARGWSSAERDTKFLAELARLFPSVAERFVRSRWMDWPGDAWTLAGYSMLAPGQVTTAAPRLRAGIGRLHFAGEHCSTAFAGYMEGALESGVAAARRIAKKDGVAR